MIILVEFAVGITAVLSGFGFKHTYVVSICAVMGHSCGVNMYVYVMSPLIFIAILVSTRHSYWAPVFCGSLFNCNIRNICTLEVISHRRMVFAHLFLL